MAKFPNEQLDEILSPLRIRIQALEAALSPTAETKGAYIGEFTTWGCNECGDVTVEWRTIKDIMRVIREYALDEMEPDSAPEKARCSDKVFRDNIQHHMG